MKSLIQTFLDLCFLQSEPKNLPCSRLLFSFVVVVNVWAGMTLAMVAGNTPENSWSAAAREPILVLCFLYLCLGIRRLPDRFVQTGTALMGATAFLDMISIPVTRLAVGQADGTRGAGGAMMLLILMVLWGIAVMGYILGHALNTPMKSGVIMGAVYTALCYVSFVVPK